MNVETHADTTCLYRFIGETEFERILTNRSFLLKRPSLWKDQWEGFPFKLLDNPEGKSIVTSYFKEHDISLFSDFVQLLKDTIYCLCFTMTLEDQSLWSSYCYDRKCIRIKLRRVAMESILPAGPLFALKQVAYADGKVLRNELERHLAKIVYRDGETTKVEPFNGYAVKRTEFQHENEVRLLHYHPANLTVYHEGHNGNVFHLNRAGVRTGTTLSDVFELKFSVSLGSLFESILGHPESDDSFLQRIEALCARNGLVFDGKSKLYDLHYRKRE